MVIHAKDLLDANDRTIGRVATMYESFAKLITFFLGLITSIVTVVAATFGFLAFRSLRDFRKRWDKELQDAKHRLGIEIEELKDLAAREVQSAVNSIRGNELRVQESAARAESSAALLQERQDVLNDYLNRYDALAARVEELQEVMKAAGLPLPAPPAATTEGMPLSADVLVGKKESDAVNALVEEKVTNEAKR